MTAPPKPQGPLTRRLGDPRRNLYRLAGRALEKLSELLEHEDPQVVLAAIKEVLDRADALPKPDPPAPRIRGQKIWQGGQEALLAGSVTDRED